MQLRRDQRRDFREIVATLIQSLPDTEDQLDLAGKVCGALGRPESAKPVAVSISKAKTGQLLGGKAWADLLRGLGSLIDQLNGDSKEEQARLRWLLMKVQAPTIPDVPARAPKMLKQVEAIVDAQRELVPFLIRAMTEDVPLVVLAEQYMSGELNKMQRELHHCVTDLDRPPRIFEPSNTGQPGMLDQCGAYSPLDHSLALRWGRAATTPVLYLFPFILTAPRRFGWGVIPYAWQREIGVVLSDDLAKRWTGSEVDSDRFQDWVQQIASPGTLRIFNVQGYSAEDILCQMVVEWESEEAIRLVSDSLAPELESLDHLPEFLDKQFNRSSKFVDLLLLDLAEVPRVQPDLDRFECKLVRLRHGADIPIGIGFSLAALPWVAKDDRFEKLRRCAFDALLAQSGTTDMLKEMGIELISEGDNDNGTDARPAQ